MAKLIVTIDGPAASGKTTVARLLARRLGAVFLDTGAMYRAVTLAAMRAGIDLNNQKQLLDLMEQTQFEFIPGRDATVVKINDTDVTEEIRGPEVTANARFIADAGPVRTKLVELQRQFARHHERIVTEGRDQGTVAFPAASVKFFLTADRTERARRRLAELADRTGCTLADVEQAIDRRDSSDRSRRIGPLRPADDAIVIDTTGLTVYEVVEKLLALVKEKCPHQL